MSWIISLFELVLILTGLITASLTIFVWYQRYVQIRITFFVLLLAITEWTFTALLEVSAVEPTAKILWSKIEYLGIATVPTLFLMFVLTYSYLEKFLTRRNMILLGMMPLVTIVMAFTNDFHHWLWSSYNFNDSLNIMTYGHGIWFWLNVIYSYLLILAASIILIWDILRFPNLYKRQAWGIILAAIFPWISNAVYIFKILSYPSLDWTSVGFSISCLFFFLVLFKFHLLDLVPIARETILDGLGEGIIVLDERDRIVDLNSTARKFLKIASDEILGQPAVLAFSTWPELAWAVRGNEDKKLEITTTMVGLVISGRRISLPA